MSALPTPAYRRLSDVVPLADLAAEIASGHVRRRQHPELPLSVYAYAEKCLYEGRWNAVTATCRGLVVDDLTGEVVATPFAKFHALGAHTGGAPYAAALPDEPFEVFDKVDGTLGVVFHFAGAWQVATKAAFASTQARWAMRWLAARDTSGLTVGTTYLAEIVYPENRIVVNHAGRRTLVLLGAFAADGTEIPLAEAAQEWRSTGGEVVSVRPAPSITELARLAAESRDLDGTELTGLEAEGWVVRFASGLRVKIKLDDYIRLHGTITHTSERTVWEALAAGHDLSTLFTDVPDEFIGWVDRVADRLRREHAEWIDAAQRAFALIGETPDRRTFAERVRAAAYTPHAAMFNLLDGKSINSMAWQAVKPANTDPYVTEG